MATKDWHKSTEGRILTEFIKKENQNYIVSIVKLKQRKPAFNVELYEQDKGTKIINEKPLSKSQALSFAKKYMRTH